MRQTKEIELLGCKVLISERNTIDVLDLVKFVENKSLDAKTSAFINARILEDSLQYYFQRINFIRRYFLRRKFTANKLIRQLTNNELNEYALEVLKLEGVDLKKKLREMESQLVEKLPDV